VNMRRIIPVVFVLLAFVLSDMVVAQKFYRPRPTEQYRPPHPIDPLRPHESYKGSAETEIPEGKVGTRNNFIWRKFFKKKTAWDEASSESPRESHRIPVDIKEDRPGAASLSPVAGVILPIGGAFRDVFGRPLRSGEEAKMLDFQKEFQKSDVEILGEQGMDADSLREWIQVQAKKRGRPVVIIGHSTSVNGIQRLALPEGVVEISKIHEWAAEVGTECIVVTCFGKDVELNSRIRFDEVLSVWKMANESMSLDSDSAVPLDQKGTEVPTPNQLDQFVLRIARSRSHFNSRHIHISVSTPAKRPLFGCLPTQKTEGEFVVWEIAMARPDRTILMTILISLGLGMLHYVMHRASLEPVGFRPTTSDSFRRAMAQAFRHLIANRRTMLVTATVTSVLAMCVFVTGSEWFMDWDEGSYGGRWEVHTSAVLGGFFAALAGSVQLSEPKKSIFGTVVYSLSGMTVGATSVFLLFVVLFGIIGCIIGIFIVLPYCVLFDSINAVSNFVESIEIFLAVGAAFGPLFAIGGIFSGMKAGLKQTSVHVAAFEAVGKMMDNGKS
jgi:hypothetical protein